MSGSQSREDAQAAILRNAGDYEAMRDLKATNAEYFRLMDRFRADRGEARHPADGPQPSSNGSSRNRGDRQGSRQGGYRRD